MGPWRIWTGRFFGVVLALEGESSEEIEDAVAGAVGFAAAAAFGAGDVEEELSGLGVGGDDFEEALTLAGGTAVFVGVEVAAGGAAAVALSGHASAPIGRRWAQMNADVLLRQA